MMFNMRRADLGRRSEGFRRDLGKALGKGFCIGMAFGPMSPIFVAF